MRIFPPPPSSSLIQVLSAYREYFEHLADKGIVTTKLIFGRLEYTENLKDGLGKKRK